MTTYYMPAARNIDTKQLIKSQDLSGRRYSKFEQEAAWSIADRLAENQSRRDRETWVPELLEYEVL